jgi:hypothetical protein
VPKKGTKVILKDGRSAIVQKSLTKSSFLVALPDGTPATVARADIAKEVRRMCEMCTTSEAMLNERFCKDCRKAKLEELKECGYLQRAPSPPFRRYLRAREQKENVHETKHGVDDYRIMPEPSSEL